MAARTSLLGTEEERAHKHYHDPEKKDAEPDGALRCNPCHCLSLRACGYLIR